MASSMCNAHRRCQWEMMPHDFPPYTTVYGYFQKWQRQGIWQQMHDQIRQQLRTELGRDEHSTVAIAACQSVKTTEKRERSTVSTVARRLKGALGHIIVDSQGLLMGVLVTEANASQRLGAVLVLDEAKEKLSRVEVLWVDQEYSGKNRLLAKYSSSRLHRTHRRGDTLPFRKGFAQRERPWRT
jgi:putative transposase